MYYYSIVQLYLLSNQYYLPLVIHGISQRFLLLLNVTRMLPLLESSEGGSRKVAPKRLGNGFLSCFLQHLYIVSVNSINFVAL